MLYRCPGQSDRYLRAEIFPCSRCGYQVEIFSDELRTRCPCCGEMVFRERIPSCIDWCSAAKKCIGWEKWKKIKGEIG